MDIDSAEDVFLRMPMNDSEIKFLAYNFYRDENGEDQSVVDGISIGETLASSLWQGFSSIARHYQEFGLGGRRNETIVLPKDASALRIKVASVFSTVSVTGSPIGQFQYDEEQWGFKNLPIVRLSRIFRIAQWPIRSSIRRKKILSIAGWTMRHDEINKKDVVVLFRKSLLNGASPILKRNFIRHGDKIFNLENNVHFSKQTFVQTLERYGTEWDDLVIDLCVEFATNLYSEMRSNLVLCFALYSDLLDNYRPKVCRVQADFSPDWIIVYQLCRKMGIRTESYLDGYPIIPLCPISRDRSGKGWLVDDVVAFGRGHADLISTMDFPCERILLKEPPFRHLQIENVKIFDFIIVSSFANCFSMYGDQLSPVATMKAVLEVVTKVGAKSIGIKIKTIKERKYIEPLIKNLHIPVEILEGPFNSHVNKASAIIGGISTAIAESTIAGIPYFVFEPPEQGYTDELINKSQVIKLERVARTKHQLENLIIKGQTSWTATLEDLSNI